jgi:hypothetical protein
MRSRGSNHDLEGLPSGEQILAQAAERQANNSEARTSPLFVGKAL